MLKKSLKSLRGSKLLRGSSQMARCVIVRSLRVVVKLLRGGDVYQFKKIEEIKFLDHRVISKKS